MLPKAVRNSSHFERKQTLCFAGEKKIAPASDESKFHLCIFAVSSKATHVPTVLRLFLAEARRVGQGGVSVHLNRIQQRSARAGCMVRQGRAGTCEEAQRGHLSHMGSCATRRRKVLSYILEGHSF